MPLSHNEAIDRCLLDNETIVEDSVQFMSFLSLPPDQKIFLKRGKHSLKLLRLSQLVRAKTSGTIQNVAILVLVGYEEEVTLLPEIRLFVLERRFRSQSVQFLEPLDFSKENNTLSFMTRGQPVSY